MQKHIVLEQLPNTLEFYTPARSLSQFELKLNFISSCNKIRVVVIASNLSRRIRSNYKTLRETGENLKNLTSVLISSNIVCFLLK
jgi:hypothetical protein